MQQCIIDLNGFGNDFWSSAAAWVQAIGSIVAIIFATLSPPYFYRANKKSANLEIIQKLIALFQELKEMTKFIREALKGDKSGMIKGVGSSYAKGVNDWKDYLDSLGLANIPDNRIFVDIMLLKIAAMNFASELTDEWPIMTTDGNKIASIENNSKSLDLMLDSALKKFNEIMCEIESQPIFSSLSLFNKIHIQIGSKKQGRSD